MAKLSTIVIIDFNIVVLCIVYVIQSVPKDIPIDFQNGSNYDYHFIIKKL